MDANDIVSVVALIVSIIAFVATVAQLAQQYLTSAAGYSNCGEQVMGAWGKSKRRKFHFDELRFEVQFEAPVIFVCGPKNTKGPVPGQPLFFVNGTTQSLRDTRVLSVAEEEEIKKMYNMSNNRARIHTADNEKASWVTMLQALHAMERESQEWQEQVQKAEVSKSGPAAPSFPALAPWESHSTAVALQPRLRSWDTMPSEVKKPYATTTICHMVEICAMMGLHWREFDRSTHKYHAEGNGYLLTGHNSPDLGILFGFQKYGMTQFCQNRVIPVDEVKELAFGYVSTIFRPRNADSRRLAFDSEEGNNMEVLQLSSPLELAETLTHFGCNAKTAAYFRNAKTKHAHLFPVPFEVLGMLARPLYIPKTYFRVLPNPTTYHWNKKNFSMPKLLLEFNHSLMNDDITPQNEHISKLQNWGNKVVSVLKDRKVDDTFPLALLDELNNAIVKCDKYLSEEVIDNLVILVVREHIQEVMRLLNEDGHSPSVSGMSPVSPGVRDAVKQDKQKGRDSQTFDELNSAGPEEKQTKFMDIYFSTVLPNVMRNSQQTLEKKSSKVYARSPRMSSSSSFIDLAKLDSKDTNATKTNAHLSAPQSPFNEKSEADFYSSPHPTTPQLSVSPPSIHARDMDTTVRRSVVDPEGHAQQISNIWSTLVFRMLCWLLLHDFHKKDIQVSTKSELFGSRLPVYIA